MVRCDRCGAENPENLTFCRDCGNRLKAIVAHAEPQADQSAGQVQSRPPAPDFEFAPRAPLLSTHLTCGRCGTENPPGNRFCVSCGAPLASAQPAAPAGPAAPMVSVAQTAHTAVQQAVCQRCKGANQAGTRFCQFCGTPLDRPPAGNAFASQPQAAGGHASQPPPDRHPNPTPAVDPVAAPFQSPIGLHARMVVITQDGSPGRDYPLTEVQADIGREEGVVQLPNDPYVSPRHARVQLQNGRYYIRDLGSLNGVYVRLRGPHKLQHGDLVLIGLEVLRFEFVSDAEKNLGAAVERGTQLFGSPATTRYARLCQRTVEGVTRDVYSLTRDETVIGREAGDIVFTSDPFMSRQHAAVIRDPHNDEFSIRDLGSSNGTYVAIRGETTLDPGDHIRIGQHLFRLEVNSGRQN